MADIRPFFGAHAESLGETLARRFQDETLRRAAAESSFLLEASGPGGRRVFLFCLVRLAAPEDGVFLPGEANKECPALPCLFSAEPAGNAGELKLRAAHLRAGRPRAECADAEGTLRLWTVSDRLALDAFRADLAAEKLRVLSGMADMEGALQARDTLRRAGKFSAEAEFLPVCLLTDEAAEN